MGGTQSSDQEPVPGDLIEIDRGTYRHWAVYVGGPDREVVHLTVPDGAVGVLASTNRHARNGGVMKEPLSVVVAGDEYHVNNKYDQKYNPKPAKQIVRDAEAKVGVQDYHLLRSNCEHFAMDLRYEVIKSKQVENGLIILGASVVGMAALIAGAALIHQALDGGQDDDDDDEHQ